MLSSFDRPAGASLPRLHKQDLCGQRVLIGPGFLFFQSLHQMPHDEGQSGAASKFLTVQAPDPCRYRMQCMLVRIAAHRAHRAHRPVPIPTQLGWYPPIPFFTGNGAASNDAALLGRDRRCIRPRIKCFNSPSFHSTCSTQPTSASKQLFHPRVHA